VALEIAMAMGEKRDVGGFIQQQDVGTSTRIFAKWKRFCCLPRQFQMICPQAA
jgi:hypothetical protein